MQSRRHVFLYYRPALWLLALLCLPLAAQEVPALAGHWKLNADLSDNTDRQVEAALRAAGQKINRRLFDRTADRYRGGPADQELYDRISYDKELHIDLAGDVYHFIYADDWRRPIYTDDRSRSVSLTQLDQVEDFSLGHWQDSKLLVEGRPRDGGYTEETYELVNGQLRVELYIKPRTFTEAIEVVRIYDRSTAP